MREISLKTVREAFDCCCPLSFVYAEARDERQASTCQADRCMMWRWGPRPAPKLKRLVVDENYDPEAAGYYDNDFVEPPRPEGVPEAAWFEFDPCGETAYWSWTESKEETAARRQGWCGLAGRPEKVEL